MDREPGDVSIPASPSRWAPGAERAWLFALAAIALLAANVPLAYAVLSTPPGHVFQGFTYNPPDNFAFLSLMRQGYEGRWLVEDLFSAESSAPALVGPLYVLLGKLATLLGGDLVLAYHAGRLAAALVWLAVAGAFCGVLLPDMQERRLAQVLACFGAGLGFAARPAGLDSVDTYMGNASGMLALAGSPHHLLVQALVLLAVLLALRDVRRPGPWQPSAAGVLLALAGFVDAYAVPVGLVLLALAAVWALVRGIGPAPVAGRLLLATGLAAIPLLHGLGLALSDPVWSSVARSAAANMPPVPLGALALGLGPMLVLAGYGAVAALRGRRAELVVLAVWIGLALLAAVSPLPYAPRFLLAIVVPLAVLAAVGLVALVRRRAMRVVARSEDARWRGPGRPSRAVAVALVALLVVPTNLLLLARPALGRGIWSMEDGSAIPFHGPPVYLAQDELAAMAWLRGLDEPVLVLASPTVGNVLPALTGQRVVAGHLDLTLDFRRKVDDIRAFFAPTAGRSALEVVRSLQATHVYYGPMERRYGPYPEEAAGASVRVFARGRVTIYELVLPEGAGWRPSARPVKG